MLKKSEVAKILTRLRAINSSEQVVYDSFLREVRKYAKHESMPYFAMSDYHYLYNEAARDAVKKKKNSHATINTHDIISATQFFTPLPLVKYMADNILSRLLGYEVGDYSNIVGGLGVQKSLDSILKLRILDPAVGTGNIIYYVANELWKCYKVHGVADELIPAYIEKNIVGIDIDSVAVEFCKREIKAAMNINITVLCASKPSEECASYLSAHNQDELLAKLMMLPMVGSLQQFDKGAEEQLLSLASRASNKIKNEIIEYAKLVHIMCQKYDAIIMNPPYLASSDYDKSLASFIDKYYIDFRQDLFSVFIYRNIQILNKGGYLGVVCPFNWMYIKQFTTLRKYIIANNCIHNLAKLHISSYKSAKVFLSAFVLGDSIKDATGSYLELSSDKDSATGIESANATGVGRHILSQHIFLDMPDCIISFGHSANFYKAMSLPKLSKYMDIRQGMATGNNKLYLVPIGEVDRADIDFTATSIDEFIKNGKKYALYSKGGKFKKWYGNIDYVLRFEKQYIDIYKETGNNMPSRAYYFKSGITWTLVSSKGVFGARIVDNSVFDVGGSCGFPKIVNDRFVILAYLCSKVATTFLNAFNPTMNCQVGDLKKLPYIPPKGELYDEINSLSKENVMLTKLNYEQYINGAIDLKQTASMHNKIAKNEKRLNEIFINLYGLDSELEPEVADKLITLEGDY